MMGKTRGNMGDEPRVCRIRKRWQQSCFCFAMHAAFALTSASTNFMITGVWGNDEDPPSPPRSPRGVYRARAAGQDVAIDAAAAAAAAAKRARTIRQLRNRRHRSSTSPNGEDSESKQQDTTAAAAATTGDAAATVTTTRRRKRGGQQAETNSAGQDGAANAGEQDGEGEDGDSTGHNTRTRGRQKDTTGETTTEDATSTEAETGANAAEAGDTSTNQSTSTRRRGRQPATGTEEITGSTGDAAATSDTGDETEDGEITTQNDRRRRHRTRPTTASTASGGLDTIEPINTDSIPSSQPSHVPTGSPSSQPSLEPSELPSDGPSSSPSVFPSILPSQHPSMSPTSCLNYENCESPSQKNFEMTLVNFGDVTIYDGDFAYAKSRWEQIIVNDQPDFPNENGSINFFAGMEFSYNGPLDDVVVGYRFGEIDGIGGILGAAGPVFFRQPGYSVISGIMDFDLVDFESNYAPGSFEARYIILHEMGHVLGIGILGPCFQQCSANDGFFEYACPRASAEYDRIVKCTGLGTSPLFLENNGGPGTECGHWEQSNFEHPESSEAMTGFFDPEKNQPISRVTVGALDDFPAYQVDYCAADKYPLIDGEGDKLGTLLRTSKNASNLRVPTTPSQSFSLNDGRIMDPASFAAMRGVPQAQPSTIAPASSGGVKIVSVSSIGKTLIKTDIS